MGDRDRLERLIGIAGMLMLVLAFKVRYPIREHFRRIIPSLHGVRGALLNPTSPTEGVG
jgi:hypothetical protein